MRTVAIALLFLAGCSSSPSGPSAPTSCDPAQRAGTYLVHYDTVSGNCGVIPDQLIIIPTPPASPGQATCAVVSSTWSQGNCRNDLQERCSNGIGIIGFTVQQTQDGSRVTGELSINEPTCAGTYSVTWTRK